VPISVLVTGANLHDKWSLAATPDEVVLERAAEWAGPGAVASIGRRGSDAVTASTIVLGSRPSVAHLP